MHMGAGQRHTLWGCCPHNKCSLCLVQHMTPQGVDAIGLAIHSIEAPAPLPYLEQAQLLRGFNPQQHKTRNTTTKPCRHPR